MPCNSKQKILQLWDRNYRGDAAVSQKQFHSRSHMEKSTVKKPAHMRRFVDLEGQVFGKITVHSLTKCNGLYRWWCVCECTPDAFFTVVGASLRSGATTSCGCNRSSNGGVTKETLVAFQKKAGNAFVVSFWDMFMASTCL